MDKQINCDAENKYKVKRSADPIMDTFVIFLSNEKTNITIKILGNTSASLSLILMKKLPFSESSHSGATVLKRGINSKDYCSVPLLKLKMQSNLVTGVISLGIIESLPFEGIHLLLGNDLAGDKVKANPILTNKPCLMQQPDPYATAGPCY